MINLTDQLGHQISLNKPPTRIVSLVPSITELLHDLDLAEYVVGKTKFCIYPKNGFTNSTIIGGTKNVNIEKIKELAPDLVIANKEENVQDQIVKIRKFSPCYTSQVKIIDDAIHLISEIGSICNRRKEAQKMIITLNHLLKSQISPKKNIKIVYLIWQKPYMTIGGDTFISNFLHEFGFINCFSNQLRYPETDINEIISKSPDIIFLSSEPFPFNIKHQEDIQAKCSIKTMLIDGSYCSWYGSRMLNSVNYLRQLINNL